MPIKSGREVIGVICLSDPKPRAFNEADERLVSTLASSMGVALENARLFDETRQRAAELALINEIGSALAAQLDFQAITELVGERVRGLFEANSIFIALYDEPNGTISFPYEVEEGARYHSEPMQLGEGLTSIVIQSRQPLRHRDGRRERRAGCGHGGRLPDRVLARRAHPGRRSRARCHGPREPPAERLLGG